MQEWLLILVITMHTNLEKLASRRYSEKCGCQSVSAMHARLASTEFDERCNLLCQWCRDSQVRLVSTQHQGRGECERAREMLQ